jgi:hypothetical protein
MVSEVLVDGCLVLFLWACGGIVGQGSSVWERKLFTSWQPGNEKICSPNFALKNVPPGNELPSLGHHLLKVLLSFNSATSW